jgi:hypothetical protein
VATEEAAATPGGVMSFERSALSRPGSLTPGQVALGMRRVAGLVRNCAGPESAETILVEAAIDGETGSPARVDVRGGAGAAAVEACVARAVRRARFPQFTGPSLVVRHPFVAR